MVQIHQHSREEGTLLLSPQEAEKICHGPSVPQKALQLHHREQLDWLHHRLVWQLLGIRPQGTTEGIAYSPYITGAELPAIQDLYTRLCQRKALKIVRLQPSKS